MEPAFPLKLQAQPVSGDNLRNQASPRFIGHDHFPFALRIGLSSATIPLFQTLPDARDVRSAAADR
jgi:hypothetical protein